MSVAIQGSLTPSHPGVNLRTDTASVDRYVPTFHTFVFAIVDQVVMST